ncbi:MAG: T9SS type A sorting domain-containing protein [Marinilabiliaceae bacterium]|nr:T9SS type A sorting domain-containing protein [Marinilabiliaceae bacterium]
MKKFTFNVLKNKSGIIFCTFVLLFVVSTKLYSETTNFNCEITQAVIYGHEFINVCGDIEVELTANLPENEDEIFYWTVIQGGVTINSQNEDGNEISVLVTSGTNIIRWTIENSECMSFADVTIRNNKIPSVFAGTDMVLCQSSNIPLNGTPIPDGYSGIWTFVLVPGGAQNVSILDPTDPNTFIILMDYGTMGFVWTLTHLETGCISSDTVYITNATPGPVDAGPDQLVINTWAQMQATPVINGIGSWLVISGGASLSPPDDVHNPNATIVGLTPGANVFLWTVITDYCTGYDEVLIFRDGGEPPFAGDDVEICSDTYQLNANSVPYAQGMWSFGTNGSGIFDDISDPNTTVRSLAFGENNIVWTFYYTPDIFESHTMTITNSMPSPSYAGPDQFTTNTWTQMQALPVVHGIGTWHLISGGGSISPPEDIHNPNATVTDLSLGLNIFRWEVSTSYCTTYSQVIIYRVEPPFAGDDFEICIDTIQLNANSVPYAVCFWSVVEGSAVFDDPQNPNATVTLGKGLNILLWTVCYSENNCLSDEITIFNNSPSPAYAGPDQFITVPYTILEAQPVTFGIGTWTLISGAVFLSDIHDPNAAIFNILPGSNILRWNVINGNCADFDDVEIFYSLLDINETNISSNFAIFPNPVTDRLNVINSTKQKVQVEIYNSIGLMVYVNKIDDLDFEIDITSLSSGIYTIRLTSARGSSTQKFVKE